MSLNRDKNGIIGQIYSDGTLDGGDSAKWHGDYIYLTGDNEIDYVKTFEVSFGGYVRHPDPDPRNDDFEAFYKGPYRANISRDQYSGITAALVRLGDWKAMLRSMIHRMAWGMLFSYNTVINGKDPNKARFNLIKFFYNPKGENYYKLPDPALADVLATELRGFGTVSWLFWPLLCILDLQMLVNAFLDQRKITKQTDDVISFLIKLGVSREYVPTPTSWLTMKITSRDNMLTRLSEYWCGWRDNCAMVFLYDEMMERIGMKLDTED